MSVSSTSSSRVALTAEQSQQARANWKHLAQEARERVHFASDKITRIYDQTKEKGACYCPSWLRLFFLQKSKQPALDAFQLR